ncbi:glycosyl hydrolase family 62-domain-containing protein, partial [Schizothecium vesticola]
STLPYLGNSPGSFGSQATIIFNGVKNDLFEAVQVYTVEVQAFPLYFIIIESICSRGRYFRPYTSARLDR